MSFTENVLGIATDVFEKASRKSVYYAGVAKLNVKIASEKSGLKELYTQLGEAYFNGIESGESESAEFAKAICEKIVEKKASIESMEAQIEELKSNERAAAEADAAAKAEKAAAKEAQDEEEPDIEIEVTLEKDEPQKEEESTQPPVATLYVDETQPDGEGN